MSSGPSLPAILLTSYEKSEGREGGQCFLCVLSRPVPALPFAWLGSSEEAVAGNSGDQEWLGCPSPMPLLSMLLSVNLSRWAGPVRLSSHPKGYKPSL